MKSFADILMSVVSSYRHVELEVQEFLVDDPVDALILWESSKGLFCDLDRTTFSEVRKCGYICLLDPTSTSTDARTHLVARNPGI